ncbi:unnamed protein product [Nyctereutes procyonoides]|uniref:(raccoon dog) hypothetical protein n=1 Tax=Nyctereutes procyonoides TaxID=34880 RepID=A0A811ZV20_NYCPR|nr:unnamed protein product [Nyctereutes procyonoides]
MLLLLLALLWRREGADCQRRLQVKGLMAVQDSLCVHVPCRFSHPLGNWSHSTPALSYWFWERVNVFQDAPVATNNPGPKVQEETQGRFHLFGNTRTYGCSLHIRDSRSGDSGRYFFHGGGGEVWPSKEPDRSVPWACEQGMPPIFSWMSPPLTSPGPRTLLSSMLTLTPQPQDHGMPLTCQMTLPEAGVITMRTIHLNMSSLMATVSQGNGIASIALENGSSLSVLEDQSLRLVCVINRSLTLCSSKPLNPGMLELPQVREDEGEFTCRAQTMVGSQHTSLRLSLQRKAWPLSEGVLGAVGGAAAMALLFLFLCIIVITVRSCRKKATRPAVSTRNVDMGNANAVTRVP